MEETVKQSGMELNEYMLIVRRRWRSFMLPFVVISVASILLALLLPAIYRSEGTILVQREEVPKDLVETTVTGFIEERIEALRQRILTRENLIAIAERHSVYTAEIEGGLGHEVIQEMRKAIFIEMLDVRASDSGSRQSIVTVAFTVAFEAEDPEIAQRVAIDIASLFLEENRKMRTEQTSAVGEFLDEEADKLLLTIAEREKQMAVFKQEQLLELPEQMDINNRLMQQSEEQLIRQEKETRDLKHRKTELQAELLVVGLHISRDDRGNSALTPVQQLVQAKSELAEARQKYSSLHPDIVQLEIQVSNLEAELGAASENAALGQNDVDPLLSNPTNPEYIKLESHLGTLSLEIASSLNREAEIKAKLEEYERRIFRTPIVERDYSLLQRDYKSAREQYAKIQDKQLQARLAIELEKGQKAGSFVLVDPPNLPVVPVRPNRMGIALIGFLLAICAGVGSIFMVEYSDKSVHGAKDVLAIMKEPPIAIIPYIKFTEA